MDHRMSALNSQCSTQTRSGCKSPDDIVIVKALRTPLSRAKRGPFKDLLAEDLLAAVLKGIIETTKIDPRIIEDIAVGTVLAPGGGATIARMAALYAGIPESSSIMTVNRQCSSGLQAVASIASAISSGVINIGIGAGFESMTSNYGPNAMPSRMSETISSLPVAADCLLPMGITSENVASEFKISRREQDLLALASHQKAAKAQQLGLFKSEIVPVKVTIDGKDDLLVDRDDGIRPEATLSGLSKLKPAFKDDGTTTAGNSSQVTDGAAAVLLMKRRIAEKLGLPVLARWVSFATVGVPPNIMGIGPAYAIPEALKKANLAIEQIDIFEINEAFASQAAYCVKKLKIPMEKLNPKGGAIALGHPLGCTGARQIATLIPELQRTNSRYGVISMCVGTGMGAAAVIELD